MALQGFLLQYKWTILFYLILFLAINAARKYFQIEGGFIALLKTKLGIRLMDRISGKYPEFVRVVAYCGVGIAFAGMAAISFYIIQNLYNLLTIPTATSGLSLVVPGVKIPGAPIFVPLSFGIISIFIVAAVHEFSHGVVARLYKINIKSSGIVFLGAFFKKIMLPVPIIGAFVEPDDKNLNKKSDITQYSVYAAGPFSNVLLALVCLFFLSLVFAPIYQSMTLESGVSFVEVKQGYPAQIAGIEPGMAITSVNGVMIRDSTDFISAMACIKPNETILMENPNSTFTLYSTSNPDSPSKGYIGIYGMKDVRLLKSPSQGIARDVLLWFMELFNWVAIISLGIGLANLLPLGPVDGGRMLQIATARISGKKKGHLIWKWIGIVCLILVIINICWPFLKQLASLLF